MPSPRAAPRTQSRSFTKWETEHANWTDSSKTGESTWRGVATDTIDNTVTVIAGEENEDTLSDTKTVSVTARTWTLSGVAATPQL